MGIKRLGKKRLYGVEKQGLDVFETINSSDLMRNCISKATQHRDGKKIITDILVDLGSSQQELISGGAAASAGDIIGSGSAGAHVCQIQQSVFGIATSIEMICLEKPVGSGGQLTGANAFQLVFGTAADGALNGTATSQTVIKSSIGDAVGLSHLKEYDRWDASSNSSLKDKYVYFALGSGVGNASKATAKITVGEGFETAQLQDDITRIVLVSSAGTVITQVFNADTAKGASTSGDIGYGDTPSLAEMATSIGAAINNGASGAVFTATVSDKEVSIEQDVAGEAGNTSITFINGVSAAGAALTADITVEDFSGGITKGDASPITAGKFLLRITGFDPN